MRTAQHLGGPPEARPYGFFTWVEDADTFFAAGWAGQLVLMRPRSQCVIVAMADAAFDPGPPPRDRMPVGWRTPLELIRADLLPVL